MLFNLTCNTSLMRFIRLLLLLASLYSSALLAALDPAVLHQLADDDSDVKIAAIQKIAQSGDTMAARVLKALADDVLAQAGEQILILGDEKATDVLSARELPLPENAETFSINNRVRSALNASLAALNLFSAERKIRLNAARALAISAEASIAPLLERALAQERDPEIKEQIAQVLAFANLENPDTAVRLAAVKTLSASSRANVKNALEAQLTTEPEEAIRIEIRATLRAIDKRLAIGEQLGRLFTGISLGSVLLLAALGLAITYGVMGVINMAHGELLMIGAYTTYAVQSVFREYFPAALDWYVLAAIPVAFFTAALVGILMERTVIRWLYGRTLETLLATWGISLILIQSARVLFGSQNVEVANPSWMSGGVTLISNLVLPWNRIFIIGFALFVLLLVWVLLNRTRLGMFVRAVTQNRPMASCVGVPTGRIDSLAFGLGAGIAGLGGVALSQISNVGPDMGQGYIVDSFMVVVLGGVGQLAGTVWAALGLGVVTKFLEGWTGAVIAKIVVLIIIIIIIQKRPQGMFALKGRFVEN